MWLWVSKISTGKLLLLGPPLAFPPILCNLAVRQVQRRVWWCLGGRWPPSHRLSVTKDSYWEVLDVCWPLGSELEKLHIVPLHSIYSDWGRRRKMMVKTLRILLGEMLPPGGSITEALPLSIVCWCLAVQINLLIPSITWLLESRSFSLGFLLRKITANGNRKWGKNTTFSYRGILHWFYISKCT